MNKINGSAYLTADKYRNRFFMKLINKIIGVAALLSVCSPIITLAQVGKPFIHDPSTIMKSDGKYYTFGTGGGGLISEDGWIWNSGAVRPGGGAAPDVVKIGDRYLMAYGATGGGLGGGHNGRILTMWNKTLDPKSPDFKYSEAVVVASSDGVEDNDAIDPGLLLDPTDGRLWLSYGTYFGFIRLVELDPKTGKRVEGNKAINIAIDCEATDLMYQDGWYYLLGTHGTCCDGPNSTYNIVVGRSRKVTGPYLDNMGRDMLKGGGKMVLAAGGRVTGPGHFGRIVLGDGIQKMSCHFEADLDQSGRSVLGIRPLLWKNGWPVAGENFKEGTYEIESERRGYALELGVDFVRMANVARGFNRNNDEPIKSIPSQELTDVIKTWPTGNIGVRIGDYMFRPHQKWTITAVSGAGGYLGGPYYKIVVAGTDRALAATAEAEVITTPTFTGAPEQLWRIDQFTDGTYRIMPKLIPNSTENLALVSSGDSTPTLAKYDEKSDNSKWNFKDH
jgi:arabinan endo-1,5-alpha-L-arabinosidase